jgi:hypothetical protein
MVTLEEIKDLALYVIGEYVASPDLWTSTSQEELNDCVNDAIEELSIVINHYKINYSIPLFGNRRIYPVAFVQGEFLFFTEVRLASLNRRLEQVGFKSLMRDDPYFMQTTGTPWAYYPVSHDMIGVYPYPSAGGDLLECYAVAIPDDYSLNNQKIDIKKGYEEACAYFTAYLICLRLGLTDVALRMYGEYLSKMNMYDIYTSNPVPERIDKLQGDRQL